MFNHDISGEQLKITEEKNETEEEFDKMDEEESQEDLSEN